MRKLTGLICICILFAFIASCSNDTESQASQNSAETVAAIVTETLSAMSASTTTTTTPTIVETPSLPTNSPLLSVVPLYSEITWEDVGRSEQEVLLNPQTNEKITLPGNMYQAPLPSEKNDLTNRVNSYYAENNMASMGWILIMGWGGPGGIQTEFHHESGYFLMVSTSAGEFAAITVWISEQTSSVPAGPLAPNP